MDGSSVIPPFWLPRVKPTCPDLRIFARGDSSVLQWFPDPPAVRHRRVRFIGQGEIAFETGVLSGTLASLVEAVIERLKDSLETGWEDLEEEWNAIRSSTAEEPARCRCMARLGLDPYNVDADVLGLVEEAIATLPGPLLDELASAVGPEELDRSRRWILRCQDQLAQKRNRTGILDLRRKLPPSRPSAVPWETGYRRAREFRRVLDAGDDEAIDLQAILRERLALNSRRDVVVRTLRQSGLEAVAGATRRGSAGIFLAGSVPAPVWRFRLSRALYGLITAPTIDQSIVSLVTTSHTPFQAESRAFAAELLLPASLLRGELSSQRYVHESRIDELARKYRVSALLITHQIDNHRIAVSPISSRWRDSLF